MSDPTRRDRLALLLGQDVNAVHAVNGLDFVEITNDAQTTLSVHFLNGVTVGSLSATDVTIRGGQRIPTVTAAVAGWRFDLQQRPVLDLTVGAPGDFSTYVLSISSSKIDPFFASVPFSFKARCPTAFDCEPPAHVCPPPEGDVPPIDYLAKDFLSFRKALRDFSALRYPEWQETSEADFGVMFMEALCKIGDDLSYLQDRFSWEATLETATQRRSVVRHARMVDYEPAPAVIAHVLLQLDVAAGVTSIPPGLAVLATAPDGATIPFETGTGLRDTTPQAVTSLLNRSAVLRVYYRDDSENCLHAGSTEMLLTGHLTLKAGTALLIDTRAAVEADPPLREVIHLNTDSSTSHDDLFGADFTRVTWDAAEALRFDHDVTLDAGDSRTVVAGNLVPATQGKRVTELFAVDAAVSPATPLAVVRDGRYLFTLREAPLAYRAADSTEAAPLPEIDLQEQSSPPQTWNWKRHLLDARPGEEAFAVEPFRFRRAGELPGGGSFYEDDGDGGETIRFGEGTFGAIPDSATLFRVTYRTGAGGRGNVAADSICRLDPQAATTGVVAVTNPFPAAGGADEEPNERVRRLAPYAFRATQFRAVRPEDYSEAARTLPWVSNAGTTFRWTGSWLTVFTTADAKGNAVPGAADRGALAETLDRRRMAGRPVNTPQPVFSALDLAVTVCAAANAQRGAVEAAVLSALTPSPSGGFFHPDRFTFGTPLYRSRLEAAIQGVPGVAGVVDILYRRRGRDLTTRVMPAVVAIAVHEILRVDNDPNRPDDGSVAVRVMGGR
jgi:hypothetical protein